MAKFNGFGGFGGGNNMQALMKQAQKMQEDALKAQQELEESEFEGVSGGGLVKVVVNGAYETLSVSIEPQAIDPDDKEMLEDLIVVALKDAHAKIEASKQQKLGRFGGLM